MIQYNTIRTKYSNINSTTFALYFNGLNARLVDGYLKVSAVKLPPFEWEILPNGPEGAYGITVPHSPPSNWFIMGGDPAVEHPVIISETRSQIKFFRGPPWR